jgi:hypothetical protein
VEEAEGELAAHVRFLRGRYGDLWRELPEALGRPLERAEALLTSGPVPSAATTSLTAAIARARLVGPLAAAMGEIVHNEGEVLEQALFARLLELPLHRLSVVVDAVLELAVAPRAEPAWASPAAAQAADLVLDALGDDLTAAARTHHAVYAQFTDRIWDVPERRLQKGRRLWRPIAWLRLRRALAASSRDLRAPRPLAVVVDLVVEARAARTRLSMLAPVLATHLGEHDRGPLTDVGAARVSLAAVRHLHEALGDRLDSQRLARLLAADAFRSDAVLEPARNLRTALRAWTSDVAKLDGCDALATNGVELAMWATRVDESLPVVETAVRAVERLGGTTATLRDLVNDLLARERFNDLTWRLPRSAVEEIMAGSAS